MPIAAPASGVSLFGSTAAVASSTLVPHVYPAAVAGRPYLLDLNSDQFKFETIPFLRQQADQSSSPAEASVNPDDLWRRAQDSWHAGAGQRFRDRPDSESTRFYTSKGVDPWTRYQLTLLPNTDRKLSSANTNLTLMPVGSYLYLIDGGGANVGLKYTQDVTVDTPVWTTVTGTPATAPLVNGIASDGYNVWTAHGANGVYATTRGAATTASYNTLACTLLGYVKGRLMAANGASIYNITSGTPPAALFTQANSDFAWVGFAEGQASIYAAGYSGDKSLIYRITVKQDATALDAPIVAGELPDGEIVRSVYGYLGYVLIGSDKGWRFAIPDQQGNLQIGPLVQTTNAVRCFEGQDRFCWFGYTNYDATSTGLGRLDVTVFSEATGAPAYASDLMAGTGETYKYLRLDGTSGRAATPDSVPLSITGDIDIRVRCSLDDWTPAAEQGLVAKWEGGALNHESFILRILPGGQIKLYWSETGTGASINSTSTVATGFVDGTVHWVRATMDVDTGAAQHAVKFYVSDDDTNDHAAVVWTQLGTTVTTAGVTSIYDGGAELAVGGALAGATSPPTGNFYAAAIKNGYDGAGSVVASPVFGTAPAASGGTDAQSNVWTLFGTAAIATATDTKQGNVLSVCTFQNVRVFTVSGAGVYAEHTSKVATGTIESGYIGFGLPDRKIALFLDVRTKPLAGSWSSSVSTDDDSYIGVWTETAATSTGAEGTLQESGERFEVRLTLNRSASAITTGPTVVRWTLKANASGSSGARSFVTVPLLLHDTIRIKGRAAQLDPQEEFRFLDGLRSSRNLFTLQLGNQSYSALLDDYSYQVYDATQRDLSWNGTFVGKFKVVS